MTFVPCLRGNLLCWTCCVLDDKTEFVACLLSGDGTTGGGEMFPLWDCVSICWFGFKGRSSQDRLAALGDDNLLLFCWLGKDVKLFPTSAEAPNCINDCLAAVVLDESLLPCVKSPWSLFACARLPMAEGGCRVCSVSSWLCCESRPLSSAGRALDLLLRWSCNDGIGEEPIERRPVKIRSITKCHWLLLRTFIFQSCSEVDPVEVWLESNRLINRSEESYFLAVSWP